MCVINTHLKAIAHIQAMGEEEGVCTSFSSDLSSLWILVLVPALLMKHEVEKIAVT